MKADHHIKDGGFASAIRTEETRDFPAVHGKADAPDYFLAAEALVEILDHELMRIRKDSRARKLRGVIA
jgi:hypothetical protein